MDKATYKRRIWTYRQRRKVFRNHVKNLSKKIRQWEACLRNREIEEKKRKIIIGKLIKRVNEYFDIDIKEKKQNKKYVLARNIYFKIGLERKLKGTHLAKEIGKSSKAAAKGRLKLLISFKHDNKIKQTYHSFKKYFEN